MITLDDTEARDRAVRAIRDQLVDKFDPLEIWLFGSAARDETHRDSDLDLLVVTEFGDSSAKDMAVQMRRAAKEAARVPMDIVPMSPERFAEDRELFGSFAHLVTEDGERIYVREDRSAPVV